MKVIEVDGKETLGELSSEMLAELVEKKPDAVLGLATGSTPEDTYKKLIKKINTRKLDTSRLTTINLDEYEGLSPDHPMSYHAFMKEHLYQPLGLSEAQTHLPKGDAPDLYEEAERYERLIQECGGIDLQLLGIGENGHIGFNEPGTPFTTRTHVVDLTANTREVNARFFDRLEDVPHRAITMGITSIMEARKVVLLANGDRKKDAMTRLIAGAINEEAPASILKKHPDFTIIADKAALAGIPADVRANWG
nr:glucosamine-6-phosphate deaminase [Bacillus piscicola]